MSEREMIDLLESFRVGGTNNDVLRDRQTRLGLSALYFIRANFDNAPVRIYFGARSKALSADWSNIEQELRRTLRALGIAETDSDNIFEIYVLKNPESEIEMLMKDIDPYIASHAGAVKLKHADEATGFVVVSLSGSCSGCPSSMATLRMGVETHLKRFLLWVKEVQPAEAPHEPDFDFSL